MERNSIEFAATVAQKNGITDLMVPGKVLAG